MNETASIVYCVNHPEIESHLRCNNCENPICPHCAIRTPTGYRCPDCVRGQQKKFETAEWQDYPLALAVAFILSMIGGWLVTLVSRLAPFIAVILIILLTPTYAIAISELIRRVVGRRRSKKLFQFTAAAVAVGTFPFILITLVELLFGFRGLGTLIRIAMQIIYAVSLTTTVYYRLRGVRI